MTSGSFRPAAWQKSLLAAFVAALLISGTLVVPVQAADEVSDHRTVTIRAGSEALPDENAAFARRPVASGQESRQGKISLKPATEGADEAAPSILQSPVSPSGEAAKQSVSDDAGNTGRPKPDRGYKGNSVGAAGMVHAPVRGEKRYSMSAREETTKARHVKSVVEHDDSPELNGRNEKLRKIKERFRNELEKREERRAK